MGGKRRKLSSNNALSSPYGHIEHDNNVTSTRQRSKRDELYNASTSTEIVETTIVPDHWSQTSDKQINEEFEHVRPGEEQPVGADVSSTYIDIGDCDLVCEYCNATFWLEERLKSHCTAANIRYNICCKGGKVTLPSERDPPDYIKSLYADRHFLDNIRAYNQMFSMTSFGAHVDESINCRKGPYVFKISGQIYHWIGALCPTEGHPPRFLQLYIYDTQHEVNNRMRYFGGIESGNLRPEIVEGLINFFDERNELVKLLRTARDICKENVVPEFNIRLYSLVGARQYDLPTAETIGAIVFENGRATETDYDVIIALKDGYPQRINKLHPSYMSLQFPLLFIYGQPGFQPTMKLTNPHCSTSSRRERLTMNMYYTYQLHDRFNKYNLK